MRQLVHEPAGSGIGVRVPSAGHQPLAARLSAAVLPRRGDAQIVLVVVLAFAVVLLFALPQSVGVDTWLALVTGRDLFQHGLPVHETLTAMSYGNRWVDQQWLSQLASYGLYRIGGIALLGVVNVALISAGVAAAVAVAFRRGVRLWVMLVMLGLCLYQVMPFREVRTQAFAVPLIALTLILLSADSRRASRRVYWCLPLLVLWANLHGTVSLGAAMVALRGLTLVWERRAALAAGPLRARLALLRRPVVLIVGAPLCLLATPYGLHNIAYYRATLANSSMAKFVSEWQPMTSDWVLAAGFLLLVGLLLWSFGRCPERTTLWEKLTLLILAALSLKVLRNDVVFGMAALICAPVSLNGAFPQGRPRASRNHARLNAALCWITVAVLVLTTAATLARPASAFSIGQRPGALTAVKQALARYPGAKVMSDVRYADWLLWSDPQLAGRLANDARFELLSAAQMDSLQRLFAAIGPNWKQAARGYRVLVLDRDADFEAVRGFLAEPGHRILYEDPQEIVILRSATQAA